MCINKSFEKHVENIMFFNSSIDAHVLLHFIFYVFKLRNDLQNDHQNHLQNHLQNDMCWGLFLDMLF